MALWLLKPTPMDDGLAVFPQKLNFEHQMLNSEVYLQFGERDGAVTTILHREGTLGRLRCCIIIGVKGGGVHF